MKYKWFNLLKENKNFKESEFNDILNDNTTQESLMIYRNKLLKEMDKPNFKENITIEKLEKWFLEPINNQKFKYIKEDIISNKWTIEELWNICKKESIGILSISNLKNERAF